MKFSVIRRALVVAGIPAAIVGATALPADAVQSAGMVSAHSSGPSGTADGDCAYTATLPSNSGFNYIGVAFTGEARATSSSVGVVPVSTSIRCYLRNYAWGEAGITLPGAVATTTGRGNVYRLAPNPEICAVVSAAYSDGSVAAPVTSCHSL